MLFELTVKLGDIGRTSRTTIRLPNAQFELSIEASFGDIALKIDSLVTEAQSSYENETERVDSCMYLRPSIHAARKDFIPLTEENFRARIALAMSNYNRRKKVTGPFVCQLFVFVARKASAGSALGTLRRVTASRVTQTADSVAAYLDANPDVRVGESARAQWVISHARQPDGAAVRVPDNATFRQMQHLDEMRAEHDSDQQVEEPLFKTITVRLNGSSDLSLAVNVKELRVALGPPSHNMLARGIFNSFVPPPVPTLDIDDVDPQVTRKTCSEDL